VKLRLKCDGVLCGAEGTPEEITTTPEGLDLCRKCKLIEDLKVLSERRDKLQIEQSHYTLELRDVGRQIGHIVSQLKTLKGDHREKPNNNS